MTALRVHLAPTGLHSPAMVRIARALEAHAPAWVRVVRRPADADLCVLYVISADAAPHAARLLAHGTRYAVVQCCIDTSGRDALGWVPTWQMSELVWSYYDLRSLARTAGFPFHFAPLGVDSVAFSPIEPHTPRGNLIVTTGHVTGPCAEAIEETWIAAARCGYSVAHVGATSVHGAAAPRTLRHVTFTGEISDAELASLYRSARYVAALRHVEGFELPAAEGAVSGARPLVFDQPAMRHWYSGLAEFIPESQGSALIDALSWALQTPRRVSLQERAIAAARFSWHESVTRFWELLHESMSTSPHSPQHAVGIGAPV